MSTQPISLNELFRLSLSEPYRWLSGDKELTRAVHWVAKHRDSVQPGDILLLATEEADAAVIQEASAQGAAAILLLGDGAPALDFPPDFPVIQLPGNWDAQVVQRLLLTVLINQRAAIIERGVRIHTKLSELEAEGAGLGGLVRAMADLSGRGVIVQDKRGQVLAQAPSSALVSIWEDVLQQFLPLSSLPEPFLDRKKAGLKGEMVLQEIPGGLVRLVGPITVAEVARGYLSIVALQGELDALDHLVAQHGGVVCAIEMARHKAVREAEKRLRGDLLTAVLEESLTPRDAALWAQTMGLDLNQAHVVIRFAWEGQTAPSRRRLETLVNGEVSRMGLRVIVNPMGNEVICICQVSPDGLRPEQALEMARLVLAQGKREYPDIPIRCGIGVPAGEISSWRGSFRQAGQALEMARRLDEDRPLYYPDLSIYRLLFQIEHNPELIAFQEETIGPLLAQENSQELLHTLEAYFEHHGNVSQTAEALYIHRNTLIYRMERIATILNRTLDDPENRLALQLALYIQKMRRPEIKRA
jgi:purine catabolism regulator